MDVPNLSLEGAHESQHVSLEPWPLHHHFLVGTRQRDRHVRYRLPLRRDGERTHGELCILFKTFIKHILLDFDNIVPKEYALEVSLLYLFYQ